MFQLFFRARAHNLFKRRESRAFQARSAGRDVETDKARVVAILEAIENAITAAEQEQGGLRKRVENVLARAAVTVGNNTDEYLEREPLDNHHQDLFGADILEGQRRLQELATSIAHFKFVRTVMFSRFPNHKPVSGQIPLQKQRAE